MTPIFDSRVWRRGRQSRSCFSSHHAIRSSPGSRIALQAEERATRDEDRSMHPKWRLNSIVLDTPSLNSIARLFYACVSTGRGIRTHLLPSDMLLLGEQEQPRQYMAVGGADFRRSACDRLPPNSPHGAKWISTARALDISARLSEWIARRQASPDRSRVEEPLSRLGGSSVLSECGIALLALAEFVRPNKGAIAARGVRSSSTRCGPDGKSRVRAASSSASPKGPSRQCIEHLHRVFETATLHGWIVELPRSATA